MGPKTALTLLKAHGDLDGIYAALDEQKGSLKTKLETDRENAFRSRMLAEILVQIPLPQEPRLGLGRVDSEGLGARLAELELFSLVKQTEGFARLFSAEPPEPTAVATAATATATAAPSSDPAAPEVPAATEPEAEGSLPALRPELITTPEALAALVERLLACTDPAAPVALDTETTSLNPFKAELVGIGVCWGEGLADLAYVPIGHHSPPAADLLSTPPPEPEQLPLDAVLLALGPWLASASHPKALQNAKYDRLILLRHGLPLEIGRAHV